MWQTYHLFLQLTSRFIYFSSKKNEKSFSWSFFHLPGFESAESSAALLPVCIKYVNRAAVQLGNPQVAGWKPATGHNFQTYF